MAEQETVLEADGLRVVFVRSGDRIAHRVEVHDAANRVWRTALESVEGSPDDLWPPSPPFQQLHVERRPTGPIVFLIGMAGRSHWSAAVEATADRGSIRFDVAARIQACPERLGSGYRAHAESATIAGELAPPRPQDVPATVSWAYFLAAKPPA